MRMVSLATRTRATDARAAGLAVVFGAWSFLASLLIFWVELMVAKMLLPRFGGSPSVWNTSLVFFQVSLLAGYFVAHLLRRLDSRYHKAIQSVLVVGPLLLLPVALPTFLASADTGPTVAVLVALVAMVGAPFFALATASPTLQAWFSHSGHPRAADPYFLYALSNVGSLVGLLGYPLVIERVMPLVTQASSWSWTYGGFALLNLGAAAMVGRWHAPTRVTDTASGPSLRARVRWAGIAFVPSVALLGVTRHLSTDVAAFPLMWTVPLAVYLASFVVTFRDGAKGWTDTARRSLRILVVPTALLGLSLTSALWIAVSLPLLLLAALSVAAHGQIYAERPPARYLTDFYLWVSLGGAAGGLFASLVAPVLFESVVEFPLSIIGAALFAGPALRESERMRWPVLGAVVLTAVMAIPVADVRGRVLVFGLAGVMAVVWLNRRFLALTVAVIVALLPVQGDSSVLEADRTFFGVYRVVQVGDLHMLMSGTTNHGFQDFAGERGDMLPLSYYHPDGPVGDVMAAVNPRDVGVVGLGVGSTAGYGSPGDSYTFYEIDPAVADIASDPDFFTYLADSEADVEVVVGDGRLELETRLPSHDVLMVDAFTSDAIPVHLLTVEAVRTYLDSIAPGGKVLIHVTNRHLDLAPVVGRIADELGISGRIKRYAPDADVDYSAVSAWVVLERDSPVDLPDGWEPLPVGEALWTDDYSNILSVLDWD